jgi:CRP/FNR family transcriptional regulator, cyclic AMP receptor protein
MSQHEIVLTLSGLAVVLTVASDLMRRMVPLRVLAITANIVFGIRSGFSHDVPDIVLQVALFSVNSFRLWDLHRLLRQIERVKADAPLDWLIPYMKKKKFAAGHLLFAKGDDARDMFYIHDGTVHIVEADVKLGPGSLLGEIGIFADHRRRTASIRCDTEVVCYTMTDEAIHLLCKQSPELGFYLIRIIVQRLLGDLERMPRFADA